MMFHTHLAFGLLSALLTLNYIKPSNKYLFLILVPLIALIPDIDMHKSKVGKKAGILSRIIEFLFGHRGIFHTVYPAVILFLIFYYLHYNLIAFAILVGYLSHLLIDGLTVSGVNLLKPLLNLNINGFVKTGSILEHLIFILLVVFDVVYLIRIF